MRTAASRLGRLLLAMGIVALLTIGCAHQPGGPTVDHQRLLNAIAIDDAGHVQRLMAAGVLTPDSIVPAPGYPDGTPLLTIAARDGALQTVKLLLAAGADPDVSTPIGETALMLATFFPNDDHDVRQQERHEAIVRALLEAGAQVDNHPHYYTPLSYAAYRNRQRIMRFLLARGASVDGYVAGGRTYVNTPLMMAAMQGHYDAAVSLLRAGADPTVRVHQGHTAAELAAKYNHRELALLLNCVQQQKLTLRQASEHRC